MIESLTNSANATWYVLDSSVVSSKESITKRLEMGVDDLLHLLQNRKEDIRRVNRLIEMARYQKIAVIAEVLRENQEFSVVLNNNVSRLNNGSSSKNGRDKMHRREFNHQRDHVGLRELTRFSDSVYRLIRAHSKLDPRVNFTAEQRVNYENFLKLALDLSDKYSRNYTMGDALQTDKKVIATAFALSYTSPVVILTKDKEMQRITDRITLEMPFPDFRKRYGLMQGQTHLVDFKDISFN